MQNSKKRFSILFVGSQMEVAGAQRVLLSQARWFHERGYKVSAVFFYDKENLQEKWQLENPFPVISLDSWRYGAFPLLNYLRLVTGLLRLMGFMRKEVDVVESFTPHSNVLAMPAAWLAGVPLRIATHHGYIEGSSSTLARVHGWMMNSALASKVVAVSEQVRDYAIQKENLRPEKLSIIENGIEPLDLSSLADTERMAIRKELAVPEDGQLLLTVGRLTIQKGHTVLLKAIAKVAANYPKAVFAFAGEGKQRQKLESEAKQLKISEQIRFLGVRQDVAQLLLASDVFVQPSLWEGLSLAMLEALLAGIPVLATEVEGVVDVIENKVNGMLVLAGNEDALAESIIGLLNDADLRVKLGQAGKAHVEANYSIDNMCAQYESLMQSLMARTKA